MVRTQIQLTEEQIRELKSLSARQGKSIAELTRISVDDLIHRSGGTDPAELRQRAFQVAGKLNGPSDLFTSHDQYLAEAFNLRNDPVRGG
jgi:hypothetical protein